MSVCDSVRVCVCVADVTTSVHMHIHIFITQRIRLKSLHVSQTRHPLYYTHLFLLCVRHKVHVVIRSRDFKRIRLVDHLLCALNAQTLRDLNHSTGVGVLRVKEEEREEEGEVVCVTVCR